MKVYAKLTQIGNSRGVIIPQWWLELEEADGGSFKILSLTLERGELIIHPVKKHIRGQIPARLLEDDDKVA